MKNKFTKNIGLKLVSLIAAMLLWLVVVNVDDPVISHTYTGIAVELLNTEQIEEAGKCFEVLNNSDTISVVVTAKRSVIDEMSKDYIKATADFNALTKMDTVPIEVRSTRYADKIESVTTRNENLTISLEDIWIKEVPVVVAYEGQPEEGYILAAIEKDTKGIEVKGPESVVNSIQSLVATVDISGISEDAIVSKEVVPHDANNNVVEDSRIIIRNKVTTVKFIVNATKEIPITSGYQGTPLNGYAAVGTVITNPSSVLVTGRGENYEDMDVIYISPDAVSINGASSSVDTSVNIEDYLPTGVSFADAEFNPVVQVTVEIAPTQKKVISVPLTNITVSNVPTGYVVNLIDIGGAVDVEIQGIGDIFDRYNGELAIGTIDALTLVPREPKEESSTSTLHTGENEGTLILDLPNGITVTEPVSMRVIVDYVGHNQENVDTEVAQ